MNAGTRLFRAAGIATGSALTLTACGDGGADDESADNGNTPEDLVEAVSIAETAESGTVNPEVAY